MNPTSTPNPQIARPEIRHIQRWNIVWVVPIIALLLGIWLLYRNFATQGPIATIHFETAEEITAQKTEVRCRSVKVGTVKEVSLTNDLNSVIVSIELHPGLDNLLRDGTRFWVVKPRVSAAEISGLGTLIQGAYIELDPGAPDARRQQMFQGLEKPPATSSSVPGRRVVLNARQAGLLEIGAPVLYRGFAVGRIEDRQLSADGSGITYNAFISQEFTQLVTENTRFWSTSGIVVNTNSQGISLTTPSIQAIVSGGVSFGVPVGIEPGGPCTDGKVYTLFNNEEAASHPDLKPTLSLLLFFDQSVLGLSTKSLVEFRGIPVGRVCRISYDLVDATDDRRVPVLIQIDPTRIIRNNAAGNTLGDRAFLEQEIAKGLRASLKTTSFITSAVDIDFDYHPHAEPAALGIAGGHLTFPTVNGGLSHIENQLSSLLDKLQKLEVDKAVDSIAGAADEGKAMAASVRKLIDDPAFEGLPAAFKSTLENLNKTVASIGPDSSMQGDIKQTLEQLRDALQSLQALTDLLEAKPNAIIFGRGKDKEEDNQDSSHRLSAPHRR